VGRLRKVLQLHHALRHTALSRMIASGIDDFTVMAISGQSIRADVGSLHAPPVSDTDSLGKAGGRQEARTPDLCVANAALSQLS
jgi:hypothetical protein